MVKPLTEVQKAGFAALRAARAAKQQAKDVKKNEKPGLQKRKAEQELAAGPSERVVKKVKFEPSLVKKVEDKTAPPYKRPARKANPEEPKAGMAEEKPSGRYRGTARPREVEKPISRYQGTARRPEIVNPKKRKIDEDKSTSRYQGTARKLEIVNPKKRKIDEDKTVSRYESTTKKLKTEKEHEARRPPVAQNDKIEKPEERKRIMVLCYTPGSETFAMAFPIAKQVTQRIERGGRKIDLDKSARRKNKREEAKPKSS